MKPVSPEMLAILQSRQFFAVDLWTLTLQSGNVFRYCSGDADVTANGFLYSAGGQVGPYWDRTDNKAKCHWSTGTSVDTLVVDVLPGSATVLGEPWLTACRTGLFDGALVMLERAYMPTYGDTRAGVIRLFVGQMGEISSGRSVATHNIYSYTELLNLQFPRNVAQTPCVNNLGDAACAVDLNSFKTTGVVGASPTPTAGVFAATIAGAPFPAGTFDLGTLRFTSGDLSGYTGSVLTATNTSVTVNGVLPEPPAAGDAFTIYYGCNKSFTDGNGCPKFSNQARFRGLPFVPQPSVAV